MIITARWTRSIASSCELTTLFSISVLMSGTAFHRSDGLARGLWRCEPQPGPGLVIRLLHGLDRKVTLLPAAVGAQDGEIELRVNSRNPTVSTASPDFVAAAQGAPGWEEQVWDRTIRVPMVTLDGLIGRFGMPAFVKIDVEGFEDAVLSGLSAALPALSLNSRPSRARSAQRCVERIAGSGALRVQCCPGGDPAVRLRAPD